MSLPASSNPNINALLAGGNYWWEIPGYAGLVQETSDGISGIRHSLSYSFLTSDPAGDTDPGFKPMGPNEQAAVRRALAYISSLYDVTFTEVSSGQGDIDYGTNNQGSTSAGYSYYPNRGGSDVFINNAASSGYGERSDYTTGSYAWEVLLHETGHALGLKHPGNYDAGDNNPDGPFLPLATDNRGNSIMSYNNAGATLIDRNGFIQTAYSSTYMMYDFQALQYLYGPNKSASAPANQSFVWDTNATPYETVYAIGSNNTINLSNQSLPSSINLNAGTYSSINERLTDADKLIGFPFGDTVHQYDYTAVNANKQVVAHTLFNGISDFGIAPGSEIDQVSLGSGANIVSCNNLGDTIYSISGRDTVYGGSGNDVFHIGTNYVSGGVTESFNGYAGSNTAIIDGNRAGYSLSITNTGSALLVDLSSGDQISLSNIQSLRFNDVAYNLGVSLPAPTTTARVTAVAASHGQVLHFSDLFSSSTLVTSGVEKYDFMDMTPGNGVIELDGVVQAANANIVVTAANLSSLTFLGSGTDTLYARVFDGLHWSAYSQVTITAPVNQAPVVTTTPPAIQPRPASSFQLRQLFGATDPDGDAITKYQALFTGSGGQLFDNGQVLQNGATLPAVDFTDGSAVFSIGASDVLSLRAYDGVRWGDWTTLSLTGVNLPPTLSAQASTVSASHRQSFQFTDLFQASDPQGSAITRYDFLNLATGRGAIEVNGVPQAANTDITVDAANLASLTFVGSGSDTLYGRVWNGYSWSARQRVTITSPVDAGPVVSLSTITPPRAGTIITASDLFSATDPEADAITKYRFYDATSGGGVLAVGGVAQGNNVVVSASDLSTITFMVGTSDQLYIRAYDGLAWGAWNIATLAGTDVPPMVTSLAPQVSAAHRQTFGFSDLFTSSDLQGSAITKYAFYDLTPGDGTIELNGVAQPTGMDITVNASQLSSLSFVALGGSDLLYARVYDGHSWSARTKVTITAPPNQAPGVTVQNSIVSTALGSFIAASNLFSASDPEGDAITQYLFYDQTPGGGQLILNGVSQPDVALAYVKPPDLGTVTFKTGASDNLLIRAYDGAKWSSWGSVTINDAVPASPLSNAVAATVVTAFSPLETHHWNLAVSS